MDEQDIERLYKSAVYNTATKTIRTAGKFSWRAFKTIVKKIAPAVLGCIAPIIVPTVVVLTIFIFIYSAVFMLPKYIMTGSTSPFESPVEAAFEGKAVGVMRVEATGYTAGPESTGKKPGDPGYGITSTGARVQHGVIAVDPKVIPYGTHMYVPGYGKGVALDCGGAIKGNKIDLYFETVEEAKQWGKRWVTVQLYGKEDLDLIPDNLDYAQPNIAILSFGNKDTEWTLEQDYNLYKKYLDLDTNWLNQYQSAGEFKQSTVDSASGNAADSEDTVEKVWNPWLSQIPSESEQADPHRIPWSLLAGMDKVLGDPVVHGDSGLESEGHGRKPDPDKHFKELSPNFKWETFRLYYYESWESETDDGVRTQTREYTKNIKLLTNAECYDANYEYSWGEEIIEEKTDDSYLKVVIPKVLGITRIGPYYEKMKGILYEYGLEQDMDLELILRIAENLDDTFMIDSWLFGTPMEIYTDTEYSTGFSGDKFPYRPCIGPITSKYGMRYHPIKHQNRFHSGIDIGASMGDKVVSVKDGLIIFTGYSDCYGNHILVDHGDCRTFYAHLSRIRVSSGQEVKGGQVIGNVGSTGWSTGPHLHFEVRVGRNETGYLDPEKFL